MALPGQLTAAIQQAASQYGVDPNQLIRIWQWESGGTFPNPAVNSSNYGGLFGLGQGTSYGGNPPVNNYDTSAQGIQNQANSAAAELAYLTRQNGGSVYQAMLAYSGGSTNEANFVVGGTNPSSYTPGAQTAQTSGGPVVSVTGTPAISSSTPVLGGLLGGLSAATGGLAKGALGPLFTWISQHAVDLALIGFGVMFVLIGGLGTALGHGRSSTTIQLAGSKAVEALT